MFCDSSSQCRGVGLQCVIVVFPDHTHLLSDMPMDEAILNIQCTFCKFCKFNKIPNCCF